MFRKLLDSGEAGDNIERSLGVLKEQMLVRSGSL